MSNWPGLPGPDEVHVWTANTDIEVRADCLDHEEQEQARRFVTEELTRRFTAGRVMRRKILGKYCDTPPEALQFGEIAQKKPVLTGAGAALQFNQTNSADLAMLAVSTAQPVGIDIEMPKDRAALEVAEHQFHPLEIDAIFGARSEDEKIAAFYRCWTRKEAFIKALGLGLYLPLDSFAVDVRDRKRTELLVCPDPHGPSDKWSIVNLDAPAGSFAALAVPLKTLRIRYFGYSAE